MIISHTNDFCGEAVFKISIEGGHEKYSSRDLRPNLINQESSMKKWGISVNEKLHFGVPSVNASLS